MAPAAPLSTLRLMAVPYLPGQLLKLAAFPCRRRSPIRTPCWSAAPASSRLRGRRVEMNRFNAWLVREGFVKGL